MSVHKFATNDQELRDIVSGKFLENTDVSGQISDQQCSNLVDSHHNVESERASPNSSIKKVLGLPWDTETDKIVIEFAMEIIEEEGPTTKRLIAKIVMKIFDPLGLIAPVVLAAKLLLQEAWGLKFD